MASSEYPPDPERGRRGIPPAPATWPHAGPERRQPRSRLTQALSVAQQLLENSETTWEAERRRAAVSQQLFAEAPPAPVEAAVVPGSIPARPPDPYAGYAPAGGTAVPAPHVGVTPHPAAYPEAPENVVIDLRGRPPSQGPSPAPSRSRYGLGRAWGSSWSDSAQGWVGKDSDRPVWRPVVTTTPDLPEWEIDTYLGIVTAEVAVEAHSGDTHELGDALAAGRDLAMTGLVDESLERGAHAVVGVALDYTPFGNRIIITVRGTAVTLRDRS